MYSNTRVDNDIPEIMPFFRLWARNATILWMIHISLGILATILTVIITALSSEASAGTSGSSYATVVPILAIIAAIAAALLTSLDVGTKSNNTRNAWRKLNFAMMKYNQGIFTKQDVILAYEEGENLISGVNIRLPLSEQQAPVAIIKPDLLSVAPGESISLDGSQSIGDKIISYTWQKVSGNFVIDNDNDRIATVTIPTEAKPGSSLSVSLTVTDSRGISSEVQKVISITESII